MDIADLSDVCRKEWLGRFSPEEMQMAFKTAIKAVRKAPRIEIAIETSDANYQ